MVENKPRDESLAKIPKANPTGHTNWVIAAPKVQITGSPGNLAKMGSTCQLQTQQNPADPEVFLGHDESSRHKNLFLKQKSIVLQGY